MCVQCVTSAEFLVANGVVAAAAANHGVKHVGRLLGVVRPERREERKASAHMEKVAFIAGLGLDPDVVLGPGPAEPPTPTRAVELVG